MKTHKFYIKNIPAVIYGEDSDKCFFFIHGKSGNKEDAKPLAEILSAKGWQVFSIDLPEHGERSIEKDKFNPWTVVPELTSLLIFAQNRWAHIGLYAISIGAWFALQSFNGSEFCKAMFVSPLVDMEKLIINMMTWAGVSIKLLKEKKLIKTEFGEELSWKYYKYATDHKIEFWNCETNILYGEKDELISEDTVVSFCKKFNANLTVAKKCMHWFHTREQLKILSDWQRHNIEDF